MTLREETQYLLKKYKLKADPSFGQHFLVDDKAMANIISAADLKKTDTVIEVGAGLGTLTTRLIERAGRVISFETDQRLKDLLTKLDGANENLEVRFQDFLKTNFKDLNLKKYKVVANIPYYITGKIITTLLSFPIYPESMVLLVQKEVADKIIAKPGDYSKQSLAVQFYGRPELIEVVKAKSFSPPPKVDSAIIRVSDIRTWSYSQDEARVWQLIRIGFSSKRKKLVNNLAAGLQMSKSEVEEWLTKAKIEIKVRAEDLTVEDWLNLVEAES